MAISKETREKMRQKTAGIGAGLKGSKSAEYGDVFFEDNPLAIFDLINKADSLYSGVHGGGIPTIDFTKDFGMDIEPGGKAYRTTGDASDEQNTIHYLINQELGKEGYTHSDQSISGRLMTKIMKEYGDTPRYMGEDMISPYDILRAMTFDNKKEFNPEAYNQMYDKKHDALSGLIKDYVGYTKLKEK